MLLLHRLPHLHIIQERAAEPLQLLLRGAACQQLHHLLRCFERR